MPVEDQRLDQRIEDVDAAIADMDGVDQSSPESPSSPRESTLERDLRHVDTEALLGAETRWS